MKYSNYYFITTCNGASDCIPNAEHIERNDAYCEKHNRLDIDDFEAAKLAIKDGVKLIDDIEGIYKNFYVDTKENRKIIYEYLKMFPEKVGKELVGNYK